MAKKKDQPETNGERRSRREVLRERKLEREQRQVRLAVGAIVGLLALVLVAAVVVEYVIRPNQPVATISNADKSETDEISLKDWQDRVRYQRAQLILQIEDLSDALGGDIGMVQQFAGQALTQLSQPDVIGQSVLDQMVDDTLTRQEAARRGITVSETDIDERIAAQFQYFGGESPTPVPTGTATVVPTPSLTPIPTAAITDVLPTNTPFPTATLGPTSTPRPTSTPVSLQAYEEERDTLFARLADLGVTETVLRDVIAAQLYRERVRDALVAEADLPAEGLHASFYIVYYETEEEATAALADVAATDFVTVWNTVRSTPAPASADEVPESTAFATEILWRTREDLAASLDSAVLDIVFDGPLDTVSPVLETLGQSGVPEYVLVYTTGQEIRPFSEARLNEDQDRVLTDWLAAQVAGGVTLSELWRTRVPTSPALDTAYFQPQPTFTPEALLPGQ